MTEPTAHERGQQHQHHPARDHGLSITRGAGSPGSPSPEESE